MKQHLIFFILILFFLWILPLGVFIKPSQEKIACGGQRAICLCKNAKVKSNPIEGFGLKVNSASSKESAGPSGAGHYYLTTYFAHPHNSITYALNDVLFFAYRNPFLASIESVPKA